MDWTMPYPSRRMPVLAEQVVATSHPLAAQAGLAMLRQGGSAADAAVAAAMTLTVVEPTNNGLGSDCFALVWDGSGLHGLNGSGRSPRAWTPERFAGRSAMPVLGWDAVTVPGAVDAWRALAERFGRLPFEKLAEPAIGYAAEGFLVPPVVARAWAGAATTYRDFPEFARTFLPHGRAPQPGERFMLPDHARSLRRIAETRGEAFYRGDLAQQIVAHAQATGGAMSAADLAEHRSDWTEPIHLDYGPLQVHEIGPNGQGIAALIALGLLRHHDLARYEPDAPQAIHLQVEAMKIAFAEAHRHVADPSAMEVTAVDLLDEGFLAERAGEIDPQQAKAPTPRLPLGGDTVYLTACDRQGMMVSLIQSNFHGFGSGVVVPGTGIALQNRGTGFSLDPRHPNCVAGGKRPYHTIIPGFVTQGGRPMMSFGVVGGHAQPQGHVQMVLRVGLWGQNPQAALDAPRWYFSEGQDISLEPGTPAGVAEELASRGHHLVPGSNFGRGQIACRLASGYCAASDPRTDGQAVGI